MYIGRGGGGGRQSALVLSETSGPKPLWFDSGTFLLFESLKISWNFPIFSEFENHFKPTFGMCLLGRTRGRSTLSTHSASRSNTSMCGLVLSCQKFHSFILVSGDRLLRHPGTAVSPHDIVEASPLSPEVRFRKVSARRYETRNTMLSPWQGESHELPRYLSL
jgi:hypothetical protein